MATAMTSGTTGTAVVRPSITRNALVAVAALWLAACADPDGRLEAPPDAGAEESPRAAVDLRVTVQLPATPVACSAGHIALSRAAATIQQELVFSGERATATLRDVPVGDWRTEIRCEETVASGSKLKARSASADVTVTGSTTGLVVDEAAATVEDDGGNTRRPLTWNDFYEYRLVSGDQLQAIVRLPLDPLEPFFELFTVQPSWIYTYTDRTFYDTGVDGSSAFVRGSYAAERYDDLEHVMDLIDVARFEGIVAQLGDTTWTRADSIVILAGNGGEELVVYHVWD